LTNKILVMTQRLTKKESRVFFFSDDDSLVVKNFLIEQLYRRLITNKNMALNFVNKLDSKQVIISSKVINDFIIDIQDTYVSIDDYI
jgi:hypothetical protein